MTQFGIVVNPRSIPSEDDFASLRPSWIRSIIYQVGDIGRLLEAKPPNSRLCIVVNSECREVGGDWSGWQSAMQTIARNYSRRVYAVEVTNEPDIWWSQNPADMPPAFVAQLVREANFALSPAGILTLIGSVAGEKWQEYLQAVAGYARQYAHGACFHPYGQRPDGFAQPGWGWGDMRNAINRAHELARLPVWLTEWGVKLSDAGGEQGQADYLSAGAATIAALGPDIVPMASFFCWRDDVGAPSEQGPHAFGLATTDGRHRPAWDVFRRLQGDQPMPTDGYDVGEGLRAWIYQRGDRPIANSSFLPLGRNPAQIECAYGASGAEYRWSLVENRRLALFLPDATA